MKLLILLSVVFALSSAQKATTENPGGSSISGMSVSCYSSMENCLEACHMSCYFADHCNDSAGEMVACAPGLKTMILLTLAFVVSLCACCCFVCFCSPCCFCAIWLRKRRAARNRTLAESAPLTPYPSAPPPYEPNAPSSLYPKL